MTAALTTVPVQAAPATPTRHISGLLLVDEENLSQPIPEQLREAYGVYDLMAEANPDDFSYVHVVGDALVLDVVTDQGVLWAAALATGGVVPVAAEDPYGKVGKAIAESRSRIAGHQVTTRRSRLSRTKTEQMKHDVTDVAYRDPDLAAAGIWMTAVDRPNGRVAVWMETLPDNAAAALVKRYGTEQLAVVLAPNPHNRTQVGRLADQSSFYGGARISTPGGGGCTDAFSWNISGVSGMLTAGHCAPSGGSISTPSEGMGFITSGSRENFTNGTGTVYLTGESTYRGDIALIEVQSGRSSSPYIYRGVYNSSTWWSQVSAMWGRRAQRGDQYCTGASYSGEICGWTVSQVGANVYVGGGEWIRNSVHSQNREGWCTRDGDSGGSVFTVNSNGTVSAKGIHSSGTSGGSDHWGGFADPCSETFTDIWDAYLGFPGYLKVP